MTEVRILKDMSDQEAAYKLQQLKERDDSWKDEFATVVLFLPAILCFIPGMAKFVAAGFDALNKTPDWYQVLFGIAATTALGINELRKNQKRSRINSLKDLTKLSG